MSGIPKIDQTDLLLNTINEMIKDLEMRRAEILATRPTKVVPGPVTSFVGPSGKKHIIKNRRKTS